MDEQRPFRRVSEILRAPIRKVGQTLLSAAAFPPLHDLSPMILKFPDLDTLLLSITSGAVPSAVALAPAVAGRDNQNHVWAETKVPLSRFAQNRRREMSVQLCKTSGVVNPVEVGSWLEILPLRPDAASIERLEQTVILFVAPSQTDLARLVIEILRLGNDRQSFRWLDGKTIASCGLLRVVGPPYYSLLRAIERYSQPSGLRAYRERAPGVW